MLRTTTTTTTTRRRRSCRLWLVLAASLGQTTRNTTKQAMVHNSSSNDNNNNNKNNNMSWSSAAVVTTALPIPRVSRRLRGLPATDTSIIINNNNNNRVSRRRYQQEQGRQVTTTTTTASALHEELPPDEVQSPTTKPATSHKKTKSSSMVDPPCLPRTMEMNILAKQQQRQQQQSNNNDNNNNSNKIQYVLGVDEAGRGPLAGPVVAAAVWCCPTHHTSVPGVVDSKKITNESTRQALYQQLVTTTTNNVRWAVAVVDAATIDDINILQATLLGMRLSLQALMTHTDNAQQPQQQPQNSVRLVDKASIDIPGTYVVTSHNHNHNNVPLLSAEACHALIDGNRLPTDLPCTAESVVKGDGKEYVIAAASLLAKVTRDTLMHAYHDRYPVYNFLQHKGYPTVAHRQALHAHGASPIHRRSFAPLKHWELDDQGNILGDKVVVATTTTTTTPKTKRAKKSTKRF